MQSYESNPGTDVRISATNGGSATISIAGIKTMTPIGTEYAAVDLTTLEDTDPVAGKSALATAREITIGGRRKLDDTGQNALYTAVEETTTRNFAIELPDGTTSGTTWTFAGYVRKFDDNIVGDNNAVDFEAIIAIAGAITKTAAV